MAIEAPYKKQIIPFNNSNDFNMNNYVSKNHASNSDKNAEVTLTPFENKVAENMENFIKEKLSNNIIE